MRYGAYEAKRVDGQLGYGPYNWRETPVRLTIYIDANIRHSLAILDGEDIDPDSGLPHTSHISANMAIIQDAKKYGTLVDDRPGIKTTKESEVDIVLNTPTIQEMVEKRKIRTSQLYREMKKNQEERNNKIEPDLDLKTGTINVPTNDLLNRQQVHLTGAAFTNHLDSYACQTSQCRCGKKVFTGVGDPDAGTRTT
jgi:hypothetical protein